MCAVLSQISQPNSMDSMAASTADHEHCEDPYTLFINSITHHTRISQIFHTLITAMVSYVEDPITHVATKFLKEKITVVFLHEGVSLFKSDPTIIIPFKKMTKVELDTLKRLLFQAHEYNSLFMCEQRGGSCSITISRPSCKQSTIRPSIVLRAIRKLLLPLNDKFKIDVVNVVLQRLICSAKISHFEIEASQLDAVD